MSDEDRMERALRCVLILADSWPNLSTDRAIVTIFASIAEAAKAGLGDRL